MVFDEIAEMEHTHCEKAPHMMSDFRSLYVDNCK